MKQKIVKYIKELVGDAQCRSVLIINALLIVSLGVGGIWLQRNMADVSSTNPDIIETMSRIGYVATYVLSICPIWNMLGAILSASLGAFCGRLINGILSFIAIVACTMCLPNECIAMSVQLLIVVVHYHVYKYQREYHCGTE